MVQISQLNPVQILKRIKKIRFIVILPHTRTRAHAHAHTHTHIYCHKIDEKNLNRHFFKEKANIKRI